MELDTAVSVVKRGPNKKKRGWPRGVPRGEYTGKPRGRPKKIIKMAGERVVSENGEEVVKRRLRKKCGWPLGVPRGPYTGKPRGRPKKVTALY